MRINDCDLKLTPSICDVIEDLQKDNLVIDVHRNTVKKLTNLLALSVDDEDDAEKFDILRGVLRMLSDLETIAAPIDAELSPDPLDDIRPDIPDEPDGPHLCRFYMEKTGLCDKSAADLGDRTYRASCDRTADTEQDCPCCQFVDPAKFRPSTPLPEPPVKCEN